MGPLSEEQIIDGCCQGNRVAMQALYDQYAAKMFAICRRYIKDVPMAQDLLHDGFMIVFDKIGGFRKEGSFEGWMKRVFVTTVLGYIRKKKLADMAYDYEETLKIEDDSPVALDILSSKEILLCIDKLPDGYRTVLNLFAVEGYSHKEISEILNISEGTSRSQYSRARSALQKMLSDII